MAQCCRRSSPLYSSYSIIDRWYSKAHRHARYCIFNARRQTRSPPHCPLQTFSGAYKMADVDYVRIYIHIIYSSSAVIDEMRPERLCRLVGVISSFFVYPFAIIFIRKGGGAWGVGDWRMSKLLVFWRRFWRPSRRSLSF